ncbi:bifunctional diaminohydroxyphosphoribosylaminopyrimidine deaminase/5-amino-6-(5-phosphoribosylamino)uracil reductase RibD [Oceanobacillus manasiensis]|uniref:bifunctional diaminohydroxyphosphoribosylaminopyrimidine deaminase/5-amino-6-(5-phosphoribosylamino)uracil reductase RibD n=1 Tax=Oceanobacillus manasiensis TaxID=586413 RepID=UPI0005A748F5|nr:bifunctional diaminohydroxyphosphoribosylaminopyrimidine deaminase/5-amino-6-(5-phosphoribosylamino)uracil reductase RibD [Oceanobacillus manasiensis]
MTDHAHFMEMALNQAKAMKGQTDPNPLVGSVIVNGSRIVGIGSHLKAGEPHAEIHALRMAGEHAEGATMYVTLEPCSHHGRTGPCAEAIVKAGIAKVVIATLDPNPVVSGNGVAILEKAGIEVVTGICEQASIQMNEVFNKYIVAQRPFVTMKVGATLDGKVATHALSSKWITSEEARTDVHRLRHENMAILTGINTVLQDDPALTARIPNGKNPIRIVLDSTLKIPLDHQLVADHLAETWVFTTSRYNKKKRGLLEARGVRIILLEGDFLQGEDVLNYLGENGISSLLIEAGATINATFMEHQLVDKLIVYMAPKLVGGQNAPSFLGGTGVEKMQDATDLKDLQVETIGKDLKITGYPAYSRKN